MSSMKMLSHNNIHFWDSVFYSPAIKLPLIKIDRQIHYHFFYSFYSIGKTWLIPYLLTSYFSDENVGYFLFEMSMFDPRQLPNQSL